MRSGGNEFVSCALLQLATTRLFAGQELCDYQVLAMVDLGFSLSAILRESLRVESRKPSRIKQINNYTREQSRCSTFQHISRHFKIW